MATKYKRIMTDEAILPGEHLKDVTETPVEIAVPLVVMVVLMFVVGIAPFVFSDLANNAAHALLGI